MPLPHCQHPDCAAVNLSEAVALVPDRLRVHRLVCADHLRAWRVSVTGRDDQAWWLLVRGDEHTSPTTNR